MLTHTKQVMDWLDWSVPRVLPTADHACFDFDSGPPVIIHRPLVGEVPHAGWKDSRAFLDYLRCRSANQHSSGLIEWSKPNSIRVLAFNKGGGSIVHATEKEWLETRELNEIPPDAAYVQIYWGARTAQLVVEEGAPSGALPACLHQRQTPRSLILFLSIQSTMSETHRDETNSVLYCVTGIKVPSRSNRARQHVSTQAGKSRRCVTRSSHSCSRFTRDASP